MNADVFFINSFENFMYTFSKKMSTRYTLNSKDFQFFYEH